MEFAALDAKRHDRQGFDCGVEALNLYLQRYANQDARRGLAKTYVLAEGSEIVGYYAISAHSVIRGDLPAHLATGPYAELPFLLLGRLAVARAHQGRGYGDVMIAHAFATTRRVAAEVGILGMIVDAKDERAAAFYEGFGFMRLIASPNRLVLPLSAMDKALDSA